MDNDLKRFRRRAQIVFQDPFSSLDPRKTVRHIVGDPITLHNLVGDDEVENEVEAETETEVEAEAETEIGDEE